MARRDIAAEFISVCFFILTSGCSLDRFRLVLAASRMLARRMVLCLWCREDARSINLVISRGCRTVPWALSEGSLRAGGSRGPTLFERHGGTVRQSFCSVSRLLILASGCSLDRFRLALAASRMLARRMVLCMWCREDARSINLVGAGRSLGVRDRFVLGVVADLPFLNGTAGHCGRVLFGLSFKNHSWRMLDRFVLLKPSLTGGSHGGQMDGLRVRPADASVRRMSVLENKGPYRGHSEGRIRAENCFSKKPPARVSWS